MIIETLTMTKLTNFKYCSIQPAGNGMTESKSNFLTVTRFLNIQFQKKIVMPAVFFFSLGTKGTLPGKDSTDTEERR